jgi:NADH:ubiquinone oxidoreductase subunit F (NADH-binding)
MTWNTFDTPPLTEDFYLVCKADEPEPASWHSCVIFFSMKHDPQGIWEIEDADFEGAPTHWANIPEVA